MDFLQGLVEERIKKAQAEGLFDNLPGKGKPLNLDDDSSVPDDLRMTFKILKNANCLPLEMELRKEIYSLRQLLDAAIDPETRQNLRRELNLRILNLNSRERRHANLDLAQW
jgi:DnaJ-like protein